jgi:plastocyanin
MHLKPGGLFLVFMFMAVSGCSAAGPSDPGASATPGSAGTEGPTSLPAGTTAAAHTAAAEGEAEFANMVGVTLTSFAIEMPASVPAGMTALRVINAADVEHGFKITPGPLQIELAPGDERAVVINLEPGVYEVYCPVDGHRDMGMTAQLTVTQ